MGTSEGSGTQDAWRERERPRLSESLTEEWAEVDLRLDLLFGGRDISPLLSLSGSSRPSESCERKRWERVG